MSIAEHPEPLAELSLALMMAQRRDAHPAFARWRRHITEILPIQARPLLQLVSPLGAGPFFLHPPSRTVNEGIDQMLSTPRAEARAELQRVCMIDRPLTPWMGRLADRDRDAWRDLAYALRTAYNALLARDWPRVRIGFYAETTWRTRILAQRGLHATLTSLCPSIRCHDMTVEADFPRDIDLTLNGRGIILHPSMLWTGHTLAGLQPDGRLLLVYPALTSLQLLEPDPAPDPLAALLGTTRAQALRLLTQHHTTSELARELSISPAAASMQAKALREAGLITSHRDGKAMWHWCTPLGLDLLTAGTRNSGPVSTTA